MVGNKWMYMNYKIMHLKTYQNEMHLFFNAPKRNCISFVTMEHKIVSKRLCVSVWNLGQNAPHVFFWNTQTTVFHIFVTSISIFRLTSIQRWVCTEKEHVCIERLLVFPFTSFTTDTIIYFLSFSAIPRGKDSEHTFFDCFKCFMLWSFFHVQSQLWTKEHLIVQM
jgi:hypothetical protein